jgi:catechol 2,3-dioxygenase-like lactoylglutathione lyase family enzyme
MHRSELKEKIISGIQQIGIGVSNLKEAWMWYREHFGMDVRIFEDNTVAELMLRYTGGKPQKRHAALALNLMGGGGFEIWQYTERTPEPPREKLQLGDLGINAAKIKSKDVRSAHAFFKSRNQKVNSVTKDPSGNELFYITDPYNNLFQVVNGNSWFRKNENKLTGATYGAMIGVTDIDRSRKLYSGILGYDTVAYDEEGKFEDLEPLPGGDNTFRRTLLKHSKSWKGSFSRIFGPSQLELLQVKNRKPRKIYEGRQWGDLGFIHLCYDVIGMDVLREECSEKGFPFTIDSSASEQHTNTFDMGEAAGHFSYVEDPDGTLIEFVETHKLPIIKKVGWYVNLRKRPAEKEVPNWVLKSLKFNKVKFKK